MTPVAADSTVTVSDRFPRFLEGNPEVPVWCVTPNTSRCLHRFFDTSPFSPSGRYLACFRLPFEDRLPGPGDAGEVVLVDLHEGTERVVATTRGFETQMGANVNWGDSDDALIFNDVDTDTWTPRVVKLDPHTGRSVRWPGGVYQVSPDGRTAAAASMEKMRRTQFGYGVLVPDEYSRRNVGAVDDDGLFFVDLDTGERRLVLSLAEAAKAIPELRRLSRRDLEEWEIYGFHSKWSTDGERLIFTVRRYRHGGQDRFDAFSRKGTESEVRFDVLTLRPDGTEVHDAVPAELWEHGGHHINFFPDGERLSMNLGYLRGGRGRGLDLVQVDIDGGNLRKITDAVDGSGHPTVHPDGRHLLTDTYFHERWADPANGTTPLRWIDLAPAPAPESGGGSGDDGRGEGEATEREIVRMVTKPPYQPDGALRIDPHPAWDRGWGWVAFNANVGGTRRVMVADMRGLLGEVED